ncbi:MAG: slipin family protein [candidate division Zixibacteria bacterium]|nr:slipin family protein [candidate division Zixibacteria bacterium]MDH3938799.1 slipin family protein [candidate division Zixibacteria bacterium]MDH4035134.1 slipin family protein [candidate division Zixibacteria bacterium]
MSAMSESGEFGGRSIKTGLNIIGLMMFGLVAGAICLAAWTSSLPEAVRLLICGLGVLLGVAFAWSPRVANQWEKAVVLRLGRYRGLKGAGLFWIIPFVDRVVMWIDARVRTTGFAAEKTLTADTVPVNVDAVLFWTVTDPEKAALAVEDYREAVAWAAQTALRDIIGKTNLAEMLVGREHIDVELQKLIDERTHDWGIMVRSVEIRDVVIPPALEDAMSRQAQAEREKLARVILGDAEVEIAQKFAKASSHYHEDPVAIQLRSLNLLYEGMKEKTTLMVVPSGLVESMNVGAYAGLAALNKANGEGDKV